MSLPKWSSSPEAFVFELQFLKRFWNRKAGSNRPSAKRHVRKLVRRRITRFKRITGLVSLPTFHHATGTTIDTFEPDQLKIVFVPEPDAAAAEDGSVTEVTPRKRLRRTLHHLREVKNGSPFELLASRRPVHQNDAPIVARINVDGKSITRGLYLESFGAAILPNLTGPEIEALEDAGAIVLANQIEGMTDPDVSVADILEIDPGKAWHLEKIKIATARSKGLTGSGTFIGILDTGIELNHPEFVGKNIFFQAFTAAGERKVLKEPKDWGSHGTTSLDSV